MTAPANAIAYAITDMPLKIARRVLKVYDGGGVCVCRGFTAYDCDDDDEYPEYDNEKLIQTKNSLHGG